MTNFTTRGLLLSFALCVSCRSTPPVRIDGSAGVMPLVAALMQDYSERHTTEKLTMGAGLGATARLDSLVEGRIDIAMASHGIDTADIRRRGLVIHEIARAAVVIAVNASSPIRSVTRAQVCELYATAGPHQRIAMRPANEVDAEVLVAGIPCLRGARFPTTVQMIERPDDMATFIATTPGAIGVTSMVMAAKSGGKIVPLALDGVAPTDDNVETGRYALSRKSMLVTRVPMSRGVQRFLEYVRSADGARVIRAAGAVPGA